MEQFNLSVESGRWEISSKCSKSLSCAREEGGNLEKWKEDTRVLALNVRF